MTQPDLDLTMPASLGGVPGIVGMPVMVNRVTTLDMSTWEESTGIFNQEPLGFTFSDTLPPDAGHRYSVAMEEGIWRRSRTCRENLAPAARSRTDSASLYLALALDRASIRQPADSGVVAAEVEFVLMMDLWK